jgi:hypothetical protein
VNVGDAVRVGPNVRRLRNQVGFVVIVSEGAGPLIEPCPRDTPNHERDSLPRHPEYGVILTTTRPPWRQGKGREREVQYDSDAVHWFAPHELIARAG